MDRIRKQLIATQAEIVILRRQVRSIAESFRRIEEKLGDRPRWQSNSRVAASQIAVGDLVLDGETRQAYRQGRSLELTPREFCLLREFAQRRGRVLHASALMDSVRGGFSPGKSYVKVYVGRLRAKLRAVDGNGLCDVETVRGVGYRLVVRDSAEASGPASMQIDDRAA
jgi:DNA-binding response OmpR family regulator